MPARDRRLPEGGKVVPPQDRDRLVRHQREVGFRRKSPAGETPPAPARCSARRPQPASWRSAHGSGSPARVARRARRRSPGRGRARRHRFARRPAGWFRTSRRRATRPPGRPAPSADLRPGAGSPGTRSRRRRRSICKLPWACTWRAARACPAAGPPGYSSTSSRMTISAASPNRMPTLITRV
jgi:hypothetical protein